MEKIRMVLIDDHKLFRDGMKKLLEMEPDFSVEGEASDGIEGLALIKRSRPDVVLLDIGMPNLDGIGLIRELRRMEQNTKFVAITAFNDERKLSELSSVGVHGFVLKSSGRTELLSAIRSVARGQCYVDPKVAGLLLGAFHKKQDESDMLCDLTDREKEVLYWLAQGLSNLEISAKMNLSEKTVKNHVSHILKKLDLRDRTQAAILAWRVGIAESLEE
ncbi:MULTISPECIES: response regulator [Dethiosulfovibrio]|jgi:DNA-binding NarL/FixJ family response regulator|uniref:Response regulator transcription factor n=2 Tax=Dethiosulfovibrio TaxID=47054 RepID=A0ABS9EKT6_9BACT|nr:MULTISPECIES: response regulator transcription factor [Dethiosulfovibrio]MCF4113764.1 response regulator transcription factor [Dethiosulfovibrio russensis]MCF4141823.1 response regulator transcription factor [Dethiosulfovibrio marinus]MCF4143759.1 response regulator transcription factor [Dethiosulfovibrio acidaminovorans]